MPRATTYHHGRAFSDRLDRAETQDLLLLHRSDPSTFHILGSTHNVYKVTLTTTPSCSCPDPFTPCKHILFVLLRLLRLPRRSPFLRKTAFTASELQRILSRGLDEKAVAGERVRYAFYEGWGQRRSDVEEAGRGKYCVVCMEGVESGEKVVRCGKCGNEVHEKCFENWRRCRQGRTLTCVFCRAVWPVEPDNGEYLNLGAFVDHVEEEEEDEDDDDDDDGEGEGENEVEVDEGGDHGYDECEDEEYAFEDEDEEDDEDDNGDCPD